MGDDGEYSEFVMRGSRVTLTEQPLSTHNFFWEDKCLEKYMLFDDQKEYKTWKKALGCKCDSYLFVNGSYFLNA